MPRSSTASTICVARSCAIAAPARRGARGELDVLSLLDIPAWAAIAGVLDECPVAPAALTAILDGRTTGISATEFTFFSTVDQIHQVRAFMDRLPSLLLG